VAGSIELQVFHAQKLSSLLDTESLSFLVADLSRQKQRKGCYLLLSWKPTPDYLHLSVSFVVGVFKVEVKAAVPRDWDQSQDQHHHHHRSLLEVLAECTVEIAVLAQVTGREAVRLA
jgi:hypothetical protein